MTINHCLQLPTLSTGWLVYHSSKGVECGESLQLATVPHYLSTMRVDYTSGEWGAIAILTAMPEIVKIVQLSWEAHPPLSFKHCKFCPPGPSPIWLLRCHLSLSLTQFTSWVGGMSMHEVFSTFTTSMSPRHWVSQIFNSCSTLYVYATLNMSMKSSLPLSTTPYPAPMSRLSSMSPILTGTIMPHSIFILFKTGSSMYK